MGKALAWIDRLATDAANARKLIDYLDHAILAKAFRGELVPPNPNDEPASVLLERIRENARVVPGKAEGVRHGQPREFPYWLRLSVSAGWVQDNK